MIAFLRKDANGKQILVVCNFNPVLREGYALGAPVAGTYKEILNSDDEAFGGSGAVHNKAVRTHKKPLHGFEQSITITLPPMSTLYFEVPTKRTRKAEDKRPRRKKPLPKKAAKTAKAKAEPQGENPKKTAPARQRQKRTCGRKGPGQARPQAQGQKPLPHPKSGAANPRPRRQKPKPARKPRAKKAAQGVKADGRQSAHVNHFHPNNGNVLKGRIKLWQKKLWQ